MPDIMVSMIPQKATARSLVTSATIGLVFAVLTAWHAGTVARAQIPGPSAYITDVYAWAVSLPSGASGVDILGQGLGLGAASGCSATPSLAQAEQGTVEAIALGFHTITHISPQRDCDANIADWEAAVDQIEAYVEANAPNAGSLWGGFLMDEEDGSLFWPVGAQDAFTTLNEHMTTLMSTASGSSWYYVNFFLGQGDWGLPSDAATAIRHVLKGPALDMVPGFFSPQIGSDYMISIVSDLFPEYNSMLVSYGPDNYPTGFTSFASDAAAVPGAPFGEWGLNLAYCFDVSANGAGCNPDEDGDGLVDTIETNSGTFVSPSNTGTNPLVADTDGDGCGDGRELLLNPPTNPLDQWDFYSVPVPALLASPNPTSDVRDGIVSASDAEAVFSYFKHGAVLGTTIYDQDLNRNGIEDGVEYDRSVIGPAMTGPPYGVVTAKAAQADFAQFQGYGYAC